MDTVMTGVIPDEDTATITDCNGAMHVRMTVTVSSGVGQPRQYHTQKYFQSPCAVYLAGLSVWHAACLQKTV